MSDVAISMEEVWKKFRRGERHDSLRDLVPAVARRILHGAPPANQLEKGDFWALRDVSFEVKRGDALGIIGHNGAGKSTLLKILTKLLRPTMGSYVTHGRIGALIEVTAGFHTDLTGRENIYLNGSIIGMKRVDIEKRFDAIVEFSGIGEFIDTPVKRYSSGMNARLGFSDRRASRAGDPDRRRSALRWRLHLSGQVHSLDAGPAAERHHGDLRVAQHGRGALAL